MRNLLRPAAFRLALGLAALATIDSGRIELNTEDRNPEVELMFRWGRGLKINTLGVFLEGRIPCEGIPVTLGNFFNPIDTGLKLEGGGKARTSRRLIRNPFREGLVYEQDLSRCQRPNLNDVLDSLRRR